MELSDFSVCWTNVENDLRDWDDYLKNDSRGNCQQVSHWLSSFKRYGFESEVFLVKDEGKKIIAGLGVIISNLPFFKVLLAPCGPMISAGYEDLFEPILNLFLKKAKDKKVFYCHINVPVLKEHNMILGKHCISEISSDSTLFSGQAGSKFSHVASINGIRPIFFDYNQEVSPYEIVKKGFKRNTRGNLRAAYKNGLELKYASSEKEIKEAYNLIEQNAEVKGYELRGWVDSRDMLINMFKGKTCIVPCCYQNEILKGALIVFDIGQHLTPIYSGILREKKDLKLGHFLQNEMIKLSIEKGYDLYDLTVNGSEGVTRFKTGFGSEHIEFIGNRYWVLNQFKFNVYKRISSFVVKNKAFVSRLLNFVS